MAVLVDTSVWIGHFRKADSKLIDLLEGGEILTHLAILGELASGGMKNRAQVLGDLKLIPRVFEVPANEVLEFIETRKLFGKGLSWVDIQLLASCLAAKCQLFTYDSTLKRVFEEL